MAFRPLQNPHLREVLSWSGEEPLRPRAITVAALGMAAPVLVGLALGKLEAGFTIGLGAMLLADGSSAAGQSEAAGRPSPMSAILPAALAVVSATLIAGSPWTDVAMITLAGAAAAISGYSRPVGVAAIRFIIYLVLSTSLLDSAGGHRTGAALLFGVGAIWNVIVRLMLGRGGRPPPAAQAGRTPTPAQRRAYWRRTLRTIAGWQFPIRIIIGLCVASAARHLWPGHHFIWMVLTVALLTQRPIEPFPVKITQRLVGSLLGVAATWAIVFWTPPPIFVAVLICVLGVAATLARSRNYLVYAILSTPVILLVMDFGRPVAASLLGDRLIATLAGGVIVVLLNLVLDRWTRTPLAG
jgi:hypothetical protein